MSNDNFWQRMDKVTPQSFVTGQAAAARSGLAELSAPCFMEQMKRLMTHYGDKNFSTEYVKLLKFEMIDLNDYQFEDVCRSLILNCRYAPLLKDFQKYANKKRYQSDQAMGDANQCTICEGTGFTFVNEDDPMKIYTGVPTSKFCKCHPMFGRY